MTNFALAVGGTIQSEVILWPMFLAVSNPQWSGTVSSASNANHPPGFDILRRAELRYSCSDSPDTQSTAFPAGFHTWSVTAQYPATAEDRGEFCYSSRLVDVCFPQQVHLNLTKTGGEFSIG